MIKLIKSALYKEAETRRALAKFVKTTKQFSFGPECKGFEAEFAAYQGRRHGVFFNSGSSANLALIQALLNTGKLKRGDSVGFSAVTWSTNVMPILALGLKAIPVDVELDTLNVSSKQLEKTLAKHKIKAFFITHALGLCDDMDKIAALCKKRKIILLEDTCESFGCVYKKKKLGNFGLASTFSFYIAHHLSTIEGGMVCTDDAELASELSLVRAHGWDRHMLPDAQRKLRKKYNVEPFYNLFTFYDIGYNLRPSEINGMLGRMQLKYADEITDKRQENFKILAKKIYARSDLYHPIRFEHMDTISNFAVPLICRTKAIQKRLIAASEGRVEIRPVIAGNMAHQPFFKKYMGTSFSCPNADIVHERGLYFGNNPELTKAELAELASLFSSSEA